ncbi:hypothetical protein EJ03DRAFT_325025 [Teratosphaeria nubilosa]|uniref:Trichothecene 3-O-acetyltransferase n=1 Tax=Teratosphaeria nubilosa TaxID=161662 RepID=A0A6G1LIF3_9PEZI|nr:hypothetical protein EJ03DRAFT_325025 [Teratosphaeria nubilosa]
MATNTTLIAPDPAICGRKINLGVIDQIAPRDYSSVLLCFRLSCPYDKHHISRSIGTGVRNAATENPQLLCCVGQNNDGREEMELQWNASSGAYVTFKDYTAPEMSGLWTSGSFDDLDRDHFALEKLPRRLVHGVVTQSSAGLLPCLVVQASFIRGGMVLSFCMHHTLADGPSIYSFAQRFAKHTRAASLGQEAVCQPLLSYTDRSIIVTPEAKVELRDLLDWRVVASDDKFSDGTAYAPGEPTEVKYATYFISESHLRRLRQEVNDASGKKFSELEAVCALIWKCVVQARDIDLARYPEAKLSITVDARGRMLDPNVSSSYWGNFCEPNAVARMPTASLREACPGEADARSKLLRETLSEAARRIRAAITAVDNKAVRRLVGLLHQMPKATSLTWNVDRWPGPDMLIVALNRHLYNSLDFGPELGMSEAMRFTIGNTEGKPDGRCLLMPPRICNGKGLEIMLQYDVRTLERLKGDQLFREFFVWRN